MDEFKEYYNKIEDNENRNQIKTVLEWVADKFPQLQKRIAWNQPMFTDHGTFIIGMSIAKHHIAVSPEIKAMEHFCDEIKKSGYTQTQTMYRMKWDEPIDYELLSRIIQYNIEDKSTCMTFWRS